MRMLLVARKSLIEIVREPQLLGLTLLMPLIFLGIAAFSYSAPLLATYPLLVVNPDPQSASLIEELEAGRYVDGRPVFDVTLTSDRGAAELALKERRVTILIIVDGNDGKGEPLAVTIKGDALSPRFYRASVILDDLINRYSDRVTGRPEIVSVLEQPLFDAGPSTALSPEKVGAGPQTEFDIYAPGMMVFAWLLIVPQTAMLVAREIRWGTLRRLRLTRLHPWELLGGVGIAQMVIAGLQVLVVFLAALAMGFHNQGPLSLAILVGLAVSLSAVGLGLLVACFVENDSQAANLGSTVAMIQVFLSGSFYQFPPLTVFTLLGHQIDLFDIFPVTHGFLALQQVLSYGAGFQDVRFRLGATLVLSILYLGLGVLVFQRLQMQESPVA